MITFAILFQILLWLFLCYFFISSTQATFFHPIMLYLIYHGLVFIVKPLLIHFADFTYMWNLIGYFPTDSEFVIALLVSSLGLVVFFITCFNFGYSKNRYTLPKQKFIISAHQKKIFWLVFITTGGFAMYSAVQSIGLTGMDIMSGDAEIKMEVREGITINTSTTGYLTQAKHMLGSLVLMLLLFSRLNWWSFIPLIAYIVYRSYEGHNRWTIVVLLFSMLLAYLINKGLKYPPFKLLLAVPIILIWFTLLNEYRYIFRDAITGGTTIENLDDIKERRGNFSKWDNADFANFDTLAAVINTVPDKTGTYKYGTQYLMLITEPIPRVLWEDKPIGEPIKLYNLIDYGGFNFLALSLVADGWQNGGWLGVVITMGIFGAMLGKYHRWFWRNYNSVYHRTIYIISFPILIVLFRDGGIVVFKILLFSLTPALLWWLLSLKKMNTHSI